MSADGWFTAGAPAPGPASARRRRPWLGPLIALSLVGLVLILTGHAVAGAVAWIAGLLITQASIFSPRFRAALPVVEQRVAHVVGLVLTVVLLLPVWILVITPAALLLRLFAGQPLGPQRPDPVLGAWYERRVAGGERSTRSFADQRVWSSAGSRATTGVVVRTIVAVLAVQLLVLGAVKLWDDRRTPDDTFEGVASLGAADSAALAGQDWVPDALEETGEVALGAVYTPYTGLSVRDYHGEYVNVENRVRLSYAPEATDGEEPIDVWFFGGSAMFGYDIQRDLHTIPSEVVRIAEEAGVPVRARNYGSAGFTNFQETTLLAELVTAGERPDLVVFYDGINDASLQITNAFARVDVPGEPGQQGSHDVRDAVANSPEFPEGANDDPPAPLLPDVAEANEPPVDAATLVADIVDVYGQGVDLSRALADAYDFDVMHFWQPDIYSKDPLDPGEEALRDHLALDPLRFEVMVALSQQVRNDLPEDTIDLSDALDDVDGPVLADYVHANEKGARAVAEAMYPHLEDTLTDLGG